MRYLAIRVSLSSLFTIQASWMGSQKKFRSKVLSHALKTSLSGVDRLCLVELLF